MIDFVKKGRAYRRVEEGADVLLTIVKNGNTQDIAVHLTLESWKKIGKPEYITAGADIQKDHMRLYFKETSPEEGFKLLDSGGGKKVRIPRLPVDRVRQLCGQRNLRWSEKYGLYYVEVENINFVGRRR